MRWVIGDIHGMLRPLEAILRAIERYDREARLYFTGDYIDRGPDSRGVVELMLSLANTGARFVRGNHDDLFDRLVNDHYEADLPDSPESGPYLARFVKNYMRETLASYGVDSSAVIRCLDGPDPSAHPFLLDGIPAEHRAFFRALPMIQEDDDAFILHAKWHADEPDRSDNTTIFAPRLAASWRLRFEALWGRFTEMEIRRPKAWRRTGYFGHTPVQKIPGWRGIGNVPIRGPQIVLLDTGVTLPGGRLTAVCLEDGAFIQATPDGAIVGAS